MKKTSTTILLLAFSILFTSMTNTVVIKNEKTFAGLTKQEKKEIIAHMVTNRRCSWNDISLYGKVQIVDAFPDIKVQIVNAFPDIKVKWVDAFPDDCGKWQKVDAFPDFKIQLVDAFPDIKIQVVNAFPGMD